MEGVRMNDADANFLKEVEGYEAWYERASGIWSFLLNSCRIVSVVAALVTVVLAAAVTQDFFAGPGKWIVVAATILTAASSLILTQMKVEEMEDLRERGRIEASKIAMYARQKLPELADNPAQLSAVKDEVRAMINKLDLDQHTGATAIGIPVAPSSPAPAP
jgi:hypothetical protein